MGIPKVEVSFNIDANGILNVTARDQGTGKEQSIRIEGSGGLDKDEIERMKRDAEAHAAEDKQRRELAEARNNAEQKVYQLEKLIEESKDKLSESDRAAVTAPRSRRSTRRRARTMRRRSTARSTSCSESARRWPSICTRCAKPGPGAGDGPPPDEGGPPPGETVPAPSPRM